MVKDSDMAQYILYWVMFFYILLVSCIDMYMIVRFQTVM